MLTDEQMRDALRQCPHDTVENLRVRWLYAKDFARAIESAATAPLLARIAELDRSLDVMAQNTEAQAHASLQREIELTEKVEKLTRELEEARKDAERLTNEQIDAGIKAWFSTDITINEGNDRGHPFRQRMRAAIRAAIKEQT